MISMKIETIIYRFRTGRHGSIPDESGVHMRMTRSQLQRAPTAPTAFLLLTHQFFMAHAIPGCTGFIRSGFVANSNLIAATPRGSLATLFGFHGSSCRVERARRTTSTRPPAVAYLTTPDGNTAATVPGHSPDQAAWLGRIQYYGRRQMWRKAQQKFDQMKQEGVQPTIAICHALLEGYLKAKRYENAVSFLEGMCIEYCRGGGGDSSRPADDTDIDGVVQPVLPDLHTFNLVLATLASAGKFSRALQLSASLREPRPSALRSSSTVEGVNGGDIGRRTRKVTAAEAIASVAEKIVADGETYTHLIVACGKGSELKRARALFEEMRSNGIVPPPEASAALIRALGRGGAESSEVMSLLADLNASVEGAKVHRKRGRAQGQGSDDDDGDEDASMRTARALGYKGTIEACAGEGDWKKAVLLLDEMRSANVMPDSHCYGNAMRACVPAGNWQLALALLNTMKKEQVQRTAYNYNVAMQACRKSGKYNKSLRLLEEMERDGVQPDIVTYNTVVTIMAKAGRLEDALEVLRKASADSGVTLDVVSYRVVLGGLRQEKQWEAAVKLLADMETRGIGPDERSIATGMNACVAAREPQRAIDLFKGMRDAGEVFTGLTSVTALLGALAVMGRWQDALGELRALSASGVKPDSKAVGHALTACNKARKWDETLALHAYANKMGIDSTMENMALVAKAHAGRRDCQGVMDVLALAEQLCQAVTQDGGQKLKKRDREAGATSRSMPQHPSADLYEVAARSLARAGMWEQAVNILRKLERLPSARDRRAPAASRNTYELVMEAIAKAEHHEAVLEQGELARGALREHRHPSRPERVSGNNADRSPAAAVDDSPGKDRRENDSPEIEELSPLALALEVSSAGKLGLWDRVSSVMSKALVSPSLRGVAGARLYNALIGAAVACGRPQRGLDVFREMEEAARRGGGNGSKSNLKQSRRDDFLPGCGPLPIPDLGTFMATLDACTAVGGEESVRLAIGVTKSAAAATGDAIESAHRLPLRKLAVVLNKAGEVCASSGADSAATALMAKARELASDGLEHGVDDSNE